MTRGTARAVLAGAVVTALLFAGYLRVSWTVAATSDGAAQALQARDMLAGNWLLHGWTVSDVSFYTTELPEYVLVELVRPFGAGVIHVAAAVTYTLLVLSVFALARGRARGPEGLVRGLLAAGITLAPQLGYGAFVLLLSPDHVGTQVPLLLGWLLLDRVPRRWWVPPALCLLLAWVQFADRVALLTAVLPLVLVCAVTLVRRRPLWPACWYEAALGVAAIASAGVAWAGARGLAAAGGFAAHPLPFAFAPLRLLWTHAWLTGWGVLELYGANFLGVTGWAGRTFAVLHLAGLALAIAGTAVALGRFLRPSDFLRLRDVARPVRTRSVSARESSGIQSAPLGALCLPLVGLRAPLAGRRAPGTSLLETGEAREPGGEMTAALRPRAARRRRAGQRPPADLVDSVLAVGIVANLVSYVLSIEPGTVVGTGYDAREIAAVLPLGAVLAGRVVGPRLAGRVLGAGAATSPRGMGRGVAKTRIRSAGAVLVVFPILTFVLAGYGVAFGYSAAQPEITAHDEVLADWLAGHGLRYGLGGAAANAVTADSGARAVVAPVRVSQGRVRPLPYQSSAQAYDPGRHDATFLVAGTPAAGAGDPAETVPAGAVRATFGPPAGVYRFGGYTIDIWNVNLLTKMPRISSPEQAV